LTKLQATLRRGAFAEEKDVPEPPRNEAAGMGSGGVEPIIKA
jgi:hypothetical protein